MIVPVQLTVLSIGGAWRTNPSRPRQDLAGAVMAPVASYAI